MWRSTRDFGRVRGGPHILEVRAYGGPHVMSNTREARATLQGGVTSTMAASCHSTIATGLQYINTWCQN